MTRPAKPFPDDEEIALAPRRASNRMRRIHAATGMPLVTGSGVNYDNHRS